MRLRTQILLSLFLFGLAPLTAAVVINLPLVLGGVESFYHRAHLLNLRADFRDLDQHLASRHEMVRLLAKLPEPGLVLGEVERGEVDAVDRARARYTEWINQILQEQLDITQILFLDDEGKVRFWLERARDSLRWVPTLRAPHPPAEQFVAAALRSEPGSVLVSALSVDPVEAVEDPRRLMTMRMVSPVSGRAENVASGALGAVMLTLDVGGMAQAYRNTLWVKADGSYLVPSGSEARAAFLDFPGLEAIFAEGKLALWEGLGGQVLWVPLFVTENGEFLWVGRNVDPSPISQFRNAITLRVLLIVLVLVVFTWIGARWVALRLERFGRELTDGVSNVLRTAMPVHFSWKGPQELRVLGEDLSQLGESHAQQTRALREHARELERINRYKSEFLANVSHELRTPLNSILLLSKLLRESSDGFAPEHGQQVRVIHEAASDLKSLIDNILDISRIEAGQVSLHLESVELAPLLRNVVELVRPQFDDKGLSLELDVTDGAPGVVVSDSEKLRQIVKNFLSNAVKFTDRGGVTVRLQPNDGQDLAACPICISVADTGIGIPKSKQSLIFEAFKQADGSTSRKYGGTGLGLAISRELARLIGGRIEVESDEGQGSTFRLYLPMEPEDSVDHGEPADRMETPRAVEEPVEDPEEVEARFVGCSILVVDPDVRNLLALTPLLESWGFRVSAAGDVAEALETLKEEGDCSLVLVDAVVSVSDACDTIEAVRHNEGFRELPIVALIAEGQRREQEETCAAGADDWITKPVRPRDLKAAVEKYLSKMNR